MSEPTSQNTSRRDFLKNTGRIAASSALAGGIASRMYAAQSNTIKVVLVGCGGRGTGAASNALSVTNGPVKLVAMADVFEQRLSSSYGNLKKMHGDKVDVPEDRKFIGFDGYKKAMDCLSPGDVAIFATPPAFRWVHFAYAIRKGLNVFMEKPVTVDGPTSRRMLKLGEEATAKNLKVGVGLMSRHSRALQELAQRIQDGEIGEIILQRGYRMHGPIGFFSSLPKPPGISDLLYQVQRFHSFIWASGGCFSDFYIHIIDHQCWMKNAWPIKAQALGGRHYRQSPEGITYVDQNFDTYSVEYTFADGAVFMMDGRCIMGCNDIYSSYAHGSKGMAIVSKSGDCGMPSSTYKGQNPNRSNLLWESKVRPDERDPYQNEWNDLVDAIRNDKPYNETQPGVQTSLVTSMGRMAAHTGQEITYDAILNCDHEMAPGLDTLTMDSPAPLRANSEGRYPVPEPGIVKDREYGDFA
ncbi:MAG TPA: Gfo/Idh/MocA family oxidoreductase [Sedimentisphaerales bacterium]|nr:Gfo/Idh/MocA family oxidoreductase [Sedimentisphaerales bacterium]